MKVKRVYSCLFCGIRAGATRSAFCHIDAKAQDIKLAPIRLHGTHMFQWAKIIDGLYGKSMSGIMKDYEGK